MSFAEIVEDTVSISLIHPGVNVVACIAKVSNFLRQQFDSLSGVAEDDALVNVQFGEEGIQAMHLLSLLYECIVLCHSFKSQFIHQVDLVRLNGMLFLQKYSNE